jgi:hypothetical protein
MKKWYLFFACFLFSLVLQAQAANTLSAQEKKEGWKLLFNGKDLSGWHTYGGKGTGPAWKVDNGALLLHVPERAGNKTKGGGDIVTDEVIIGDFELKFDWKITKLANSGVFLFVTESKAYENAHNTGLEIQVTDNGIFGEGPDNNRRAGDLFGIASTRVREPRPVGEWNQTQVIFKNNRLNIFLNGFQVHELRLDSNEWKEAIAKSGLKEAPISQGKFSGRIGLQDWGSQVWYRNFKIRKL